VQHLESDWLFTLADANGIMYAEQWLRKGLFTNIIQMKNDID